MEIPVLMYHAFHLDRSPITLCPTKFRQQMSWLHDQGYQAISIVRLVDHLQNGASLPERSVVLTFDDGYQSVYEVAFPVLVQYGFTASVFLVAGYCGKENNWAGQPVSIPKLPLLEWGQIREMDAAGIDMGAHTVSHARLDRLSADQIHREILELKQIIADKLGHGVMSFAYPYGRYDELVKQLVRQNFAAACSARLGLVNSGSDPYDLERVEALYLQSSFIFQGIHQPWFPLYLGYRKSLRKVASKILQRPWN